MNHPYKEFETSPLWSVIASALKDLVDNDDLILNTSENYVIGYLCKRVMHSQTADDKSD